MQTNRALPVIAAAAVPDVAKSTKATGRPAEAEPRPGVSVIAAGLADPPAACTCPHTVLARALNAILGMSSAEVETVMALVESQRAGTGMALAAALKAEAAHLAGLAHRAQTAADRLVTCSSTND